MSATINRVSDQSSVRMSATAFAPATVANVATGFDILGFAIDGIGDRVTVSRSETPGVTISAIRGIINVSGIPLEAHKNTAGVPLLKMLESARPGFGFTIEIEKSIPLGSGMGGSAASAVGAVVAANALLEKPFSLEDLLGFALEGEAIASGAKHADNVAPCLYGGVTLTNPGASPRPVRLPVPANLFVSVVYPAMRLDTKVARAALSATLTLKQHIEQSARLAALVAGICTDDLELLRRGLDDVLIEPQRASLIPGFAAVKAAALAHGALGGSISGAGPSVFAFSTSESTAREISLAMQTAFKANGGLDSESWVSPIRGAGAGLV